MKILITGSSGLIGTELKTILNTAGHQVFSLVHSDNNRNTKKDLTWSIKNDYVHISEEHSFDAVVHLAGANIAKPWTSNHKKEILESRAKGTQMLVDEILKSPQRFKRIISTSAIGIYPDPSTKPCNEDAPHGSGFLSEVCEKWESALKPLSEHQIPTSIVRVGLVLSSKGGVFPVAAKTRNLGIVPVTGSAQNRWSWIHIQDLVRIYHQLIEGTLDQGIYNAVAPYSVTQGQFTKALLSKTAEVNQKWLPISISPTVPSFMLKLMLGERSQLALTSQDIISKNLQNFTFQFPQIEQAVEDLIRG